MNQHDFENPKFCRNKPCFMNEKLKFILMTFKNFIEYKL